MRRRKQLRRRICVALFTSLLIFSLSLLFFGFGSKAQGSDEEIFYKYYKSVTINRGDSLWDYASEYCDNHYDDYQDYINEVMSINCMSEETLIAGCSIIIPYYSPEFVG